MVVIILVLLVVHGGGPGFTGGTVQSAPWELSLLVEEEVVGGA